MNSRDEILFESRAEGMLYFHIWRPEKPPKAVICLVHGLGDYSGCFLSFASFFTMAGFAVMAIDLYGSGHSAGDRGDVPDFALFLDEVELLLDLARARFSGLPLFLYGHSMGGNIVLNEGLRHNPDISGLVASAPWLKMVGHPLRRAAVAGGIALFSPRHRFDSGLHPEGLSHDPAFARSYLADPLIHGVVTARLFWQASCAGRWALHHAHEIAFPTLIIHGEADPVTSAAASKGFAERSGGRVEYQEIPGAFHTLHNEQNKEEIFRSIQQWLEQVLTMQSAATSRVQL